MPIQSEEIKNKVKATNLERYGSEYALSSGAVRDRIKRTNLEKYGSENPLSSEEIREKMKATNLERYGVEHNWSSKELREATKKSNMEKYGVEYLSQLDEVKESTKETNLERYGSEHYFQTDEFKESSKKSCLEKYGTEYATQSETIKEKIKETCMDKYGTEHFFQSEEFKDASKNTCMERYGVECAVQSEEVRSRIIATNKERFGAEFPLQSEQIRKKISATVKERYNVDHVISSDVVKNKIKQTNLERYGVENGFGSKKIIEKTHATNVEKYGAPYKKQAGISNLEIWNDLENFLSNNPLLYDTIDLSEMFSLPYSTIRHRINICELKRYVKNYTKYSMPELVFKHFFDSIDFVEYADYIPHDRKTIVPLELDFYFPEHSLAIEISPLYTHQYEGGTLLSGVSDKHYHYNKFKACKDKDIELITIFDWHDYESITSFIKNKLLKADERIYARKCTVNIVNSLSKEHKLFLDNNHVLGRVNNTQTTKVIELIYDGSVVGMGVFEDKGGFSELRRLAFLERKSVTGGASKIIKHYTASNKGPLITFSDNDLGTGSVYEKLGFDILTVNKGTLIWYHPELLHKVPNLSLVRQGADRLLKNRVPGYQKVGTGEDLPSNQEIIQSCGYIPIYDCGYTKWELKLMDNEQVIQGFCGKIKTT